MNAQTQASKNALHKSLERRHNASTSLAALWRPALLQAFVKLDPRQLLRSPVMLVVELTAVLTTLLCFVSDQAVPTSVALQIALW
ncbi:potassium-transporting ATPase subunit B, partial [Pseudomonas aeruginosa]